VNKGYPIIFRNLKGFQTTKVVGYSGSIKGQKSFTSILKINVIKIQAIQAGAPFSICLVATLQEPPLNSRSLLSNSHFGRMECKKRTL
jgi:hypothetical protein